MLLVYDISRRTSFENLDKWLSEVRDHGDEKVEVILVGNKSDLEKTRQVSKEEAQKYADDHGKLLVVLVAFELLTSGALVRNLFRGVKCVECLECGDGVHETDRDNLSEAE